MHKLVVQVRARVLILDPVAVLGHLQAHLLGVPLVLVVDEVPLHPIKRLLALAADEVLHP